MTLVRLNFCLVRRPAITQYVLNYGRSFCSAPIENFLPNNLIFVRRALANSDYNDFSSFTGNPNLKILMRTFSNKSTQETVSSNEKDILLYKYDNPRFFRLLNIFGYVMWCLGVVTSIEFLEMEIEKKNESPDTSNLPWFAKFNFRSEFAKYAFATATAVLGGGCLMLTWAYSARSVCYLILRKGQKQISLVTYNPVLFRKHIIYTADVSNVSCQGSREKASVLPLKLKGRWFHFLLSKEGQYVNPHLFDRTVGIHRGF